MIIEQLAGRFGVTVDSPGTLPGSASGSQLLPVRTRSGDRAVLKVTTTTADRHLRRMAERELEVYRLAATGGMPLTTPRLLDVEESEEVVALLLSAHPPARPADRWTQREWTALVDDLAALHETPVPHGWHPPPQVDQEALRDQADRARQFWLSDPLASAELIELIRPLLDDPEPLRTLPAGFDLCFGHGDCHTDNILIEDQRLIWIDWQNAGLGHPVADLAFVSTRATPSGAQLPFTAMIARYAARRRLEVAELTRAVLSTELGTLVFVFPEYFELNPPESLRRIHRRIAELTAWLCTGFTP